MREPLKSFAERLSRNDELEEFLLGMHEAGLTTISELDHIVVMLQKQRLKEGEARGEVPLSLALGTVKPAGVDRDGNQYAFLSMEPDFDLDLDMKKGEQAWQDIKPSNPTT